MSKLTYAGSGVDINAADAAKKGMAEFVAQGSPRVLNRVGAFASLFDIRFPEMKHPVLVCKTEEPGSKQKLSIGRGKVEGICSDMINHLTNDILVMGATPLAVQDAIICGKLEPDIVSRLVKGIAAACRENGSVLTGGETSEQPNVVEAGTYILTSSIIGIAEKDEIIDGSAIKEGDAVLALPSNGIHTNGYSFLRRMMEDDPEIEELQIEGESFMDAILRPHKSYYGALHPLFRSPLKKALRGMAHITGGGIAGNLNRILPVGLDAEIDLSRLRVLPIFDFIKKKTETDDLELLKTFNMGIGMTVVVKAAAADKFIEHFRAAGADAYVLGKIVAGGSQKVNFINEIPW
ncbi:MAG: phosphoribosylformylglycinamidine cyclo-ligase [Clostridiales bacterium]|jgi:phosphoribosylformylglycinamidine cyclo-ligase|nr:phosphoribosylformylglycinamidine cyclo-ligase [Clostridiales bacterium]